MSEPTSGYPPDVVSMMKTIMNRAQVTFEEVEAEFKKVMNSPIEKRSSGTTDEKQFMTYAITVVYNNLVNRPKVVEFTVLPIGYEGKRFTNSGRWQSAVFAVVKGEGMPSPELRRITFFDDLAEVPQNITYFAVYKSMLGKFKDSNDLVADSRTKFENPEDMADPLQIIDKQLRLKRITIEQIPVNVAKKRDKFYDSTDLRVIRGIVTRMGKGNKKDTQGTGQGGQWANYVIIDETVMDKEEGFDENGKPKYAGATCWIDPSLQRFKVNDQCDFIGAITPTKDQKGFNFNVYQIVGVNVQVKQ